MVNIQRNKYMVVQRSMVLHRNMMRKVSSQRGERLACSASLMQSHSTTTSMAVPGSLAGVVGLHGTSWRIIWSQEVCRTVVDQCN